MSGQLFNQEKPCRMYTVLTNHSTKSKLVTVDERKLRDRILVLVGTLARDNCAPEIRTSWPRFSSRSGFICPPRLNIDALSIAGAELPQPYNDRLGVFPSVEELSAFVVGRPTAVVAGVPAGRFASDLDRKVIQ